MAIRLPEDRELASKVIESEQYRQQRSYEMGIIGRLTGDAQHKPGNIVVFVVILCFTFLTIIVFDHDPDLPKKEIIFSIISVITLALGYFFGKRDDSMEEARSVRKRER
jgi:hypothetical protein